jgi:hypothetical protein
MDPLVARMRDYAMRHGGTLRHYDRAGQPLPRRRLREATTEDLGRMLVFSARLRPDPAVEILDADPPGLWRAVPADLDLTANPDLQLSDWAASEPVAAARHLFEHYRRGPRRHGRRRAWASKLLHLHWPAFFPIVDSRIEAAYHHAAFGLADQLGLPADPAYPRRSPPVLAYWAAIRDDLTTPGVTDMLADAAQQAAAGPDDDPSQLLTHLTPVRLADLVTWKS